MKEHPLTGHGEVDHAGITSVLQHLLFSPGSRLFAWGPLARPLLIPWALGVVALLGLTGRAEANLPSIDLNEPNVSVLRAGGINPLITRSWDLQLDAFSVAPRLSFSFAFATDDLPREGQVSDSASFIIQDLSQSKATVLATVDGNGVLWLPPTEGTVSIPDSDLTREARDFPSLQPVLTVGSSYFVTVLLPQAYYPEQLRFSFQMFDYPNGLNSAGIVTAPQLTVVPEPSCLGIGLAALAVFGLTRFFTKPTAHALPKV